MTGGTIDACPYDVTPRNITPLKESLVPQAVNSLGFDDKCNFIQFAMKDSKDFTDEDLLRLADIIQTSSADIIIVTHGTDNMPQNSRQISEVLKNTSKVVVFTGSMKPLSHGPTSDGYENLKVALTEHEALSAGVYVVMHGRWFNPHGLRKDLGTKTFYSIDQRHERPPTANNQTLNR